MKTTKTLLSLLIVLALALGFSACGPQTDDPSTDTQGVNDSTNIGDDNTTDKEPDGTEEPEVTKKLRVLFLGNSLVYYNDMPTMFEMLAKSAGYEIDVESVTKGSATMSLFADKNTDIGAAAYAKLTGENWDYVIIEPSRRITPFENTVLEAEIAAAKVLTGLANDAGAETLLYTVWGNNDGSLTVYEATTGSATTSKRTESISRVKHSEFMRLASEKVSEAIGGAKIIDSGYAFENLIASNPEINLYHSDLKHPSPEGSYLAACTIFSTIYGKKTQGNKYTANLATAETLQGVSDETVINKLVPVLEEITETTGNEFNLLVIGSNLMDNYSMTNVLANIMREADGTELNSSNYLHGSFVFAMLAEEATDLGVRKALEEKDWDAIVIQLSRRNTKSAADVAQNEMASLAKIMPILLQETPDVFIFTLDSSANPAIFSAANNIKTYDKTSQTETYSAGVGTAYFSQIALEMAAALDCDTILYGEAYHKLSPATKEKVGYLQACCLYYSLFGKEIPETVTAQNGLSDADAAAVRSYAKEFCLG